MKARGLRWGHNSIQNAVKPRRSLLVHACGDEVTGLKTYRRPNCKEQIGIWELPPQSKFSNDSIGLLNRSAYSTRCQETAPTIR